MKIFFTSLTDLDTLNSTGRHLVTMFNTPIEDYDQPVVMVAQQNSGQVHYKNTCYDIDIHAPMFATDDFDAVKVTLLATAD